MTPDPGTSDREFAVCLAAALVRNDVMAYAHDNDSGPHVHIITGPEDDVALFVERRPCA
jgi:hypothetical protein